MKVNEIFASIEGETSLTGRPMLFIRFTGCPLRCAFCDSTYAYGEGVEMSVDDVMNRVKAERLDTVHLTGGEPLIQPDLPALVQRLLDDGRRVVIETGGSQRIGTYLQKGVHVMLDVKTPGSGMDRHNLPENYPLMRPGIDEFKYVVCDRTDWKWTLDHIRKHDMDRSGCTINVSPVSPDLSPATLAAWILADRAPVRLNCQLHRFIWPDISRGV